MRNLLLAAAALLAVAAVAPAPAEAQRRDSSGFSGGSGKSFGDGFRFDRRDGDRRDRRRRNADGDIFIGEWPQQGDTAWRADGFNDWWHDNPSRAFPRWVQSGKCERMWWSGGGWRC